VLKASRSNRENPHRIQIREQRRVTTLLRLVSDTAAGQWQDAPNDRLGAVSRCLSLSRILTLYLTRLHLDTVLEASRGRAAEDGIYLSGAASAAESVRLRTAMARRGAEASGVRAVDRRFRADKTG
jgi:hypothetical protein